MAENETSIEELLEELYLWLEDPTPSSSIIRPGGNEWSDPVSYICYLRNNYKGYRGRNY